MKKKKRTKLHALVRQTFSSKKCSLFCFRGGRQITGTEQVESKVEWTLKSRMDIYLDSLGLRWRGKDASLCSRRVKRDLKQESPIINFAF